MFISSELVSVPMASIFVRYDEITRNETIRAFLIYSFAFLFAGFAIFGSAFFTALNNGPLSALISFLRTLVFQVIGVLTIPLLFPDNIKVVGIWLSVVVADILAAVITFVLIIAKRKKYHY